MNMPVNKDKLAKMVARYWELRNDGYNHAAAAHAVITGIRTSDKRALIEAFDADQKIADERRKFNDSMEL